MKITLTQEEIVELLNTHLIHLGFSFMLNTGKFKVVWDQQYDCDPEDISYSIDIFKNE